MATIELKDFIILITSDEPYSKMWHTQLIYAEYLSKSHTVYYINPPKKWELKNIFQSSLKQTKVNSNLSIINYINRLPVFLSVFNSFNEYYNEQKIAKLIKKKGFKKILIWHFDSFRSSFSHNFFEKSIFVKRIYHVIDPFYKNPIDRWLCKMVDLLIITSPRNNSYYIDYSKKIINIPQCLDIELQRNLLNGPLAVKQKFEKNYFVLLGSISDDIDFEWIINLLENKSFNLVIIGKVTALSKTSYFEKIVENENVDYLGLLSPSEFYPILNNAIAGLILYNEDKRSKASSPLKALNYVIARLPVVTNIDCEIPELNGNSIYSASTYKEFENFIIQALDNKLKPNNNKVNDFLVKVSMENAVDGIFKKLIFC